MKIGILPANTKITHQIIRLLGKDDKLFFILKNGDTHFNLIWTKQPH